MEHQACPGEHSALETPAAAEDNRRYLQATPARSGQSINAYRRCSQKGGVCPRAGSGVVCSRDGQDLASARRPGIRRSSCRIRPTAARSQGSRHFVLVFAAEPLSLLLLNWSMGESIGGATWCFASNLQPECVMNACLRLCRSSPTGCTVHDRTERDICLGLLATAHMSVWYN